MSRFEVGNGDVCGVWGAMQRLLVLGEHGKSFGGLCRVDLGRGPPLLRPHAIPQLTSKAGVHSASLCPAAG